MFIGGAWGLVMVEATYVLFVPAAKRARLRNTLFASHGEGLNWRERRKLFGSEFYFSGPAGLAREAHASAVSCIRDSDAL